MSINHTLKTLGELLTHKDNTIYRNSMSILKRLQTLNPQDDVGRIEPKYAIHCFDCNGEAIKTDLGDYHCLTCGVYSKDNKKPY